jgi:hypothetical protein
VDSYNFTDASVVPSWPTTRVLVSVVPSWPTTRQVSYFPSPTSCAALYTKGLSGSGYMTSV